MNFVEGHLQRDGSDLVFLADGARLRLAQHRAAPARAAEPTTLGVRPEDLVIESEGPEGSALAGRVVLVERLGGTTHVHFDAGPHRLMAAVSNDSVPEVGEDIRVRVRAERVHLFGADGRSHL
jgi:ABC-type sugar transport system ATPase subunit